MLESVLQDLDGRIDLLCRTLISMQNDDGGIKGYHCFDRVSGVWSTAEVVHLLRKTPHKHHTQWLDLASAYLVQHQNSDGGWGFRAPGKSITDITAWSCLALSHSGPSEACEAGLRFILAARRNEGNRDEGGWGLTTFEPDRVYSTWIASYCCNRLVHTFGSSLPRALVEEIGRAVEEAREWIQVTRNSDGGWGALSGEASTMTSTAVALLTLFIQGANPQDYTGSYEFLRRGLRDNAWEMEREVVITREGYELTQEWFTSALCFRAMIFFAEMGVCPLQEIHAISKELMRLVEPDGKVRPARGASAEMVWTIPFMVEALDKFRNFIKSKKREYIGFLEVEQQRVAESKRSAIERLLHDQFPYPISQVFFQYEHEMDYHRKFQLMLQLYEVTIKYAAIVCLSGYLVGREADVTLNAFLQDKFHRPSLGDWTALLLRLLKESDGTARLLDPHATTSVVSKQPDYLNDSGSRLNLQQILSTIVNLRNRCAGHGALRSLYEYKLLLDEHRSAVYSFLHRMSFLSTYPSFFILSTEYDEFGDGDRYKIRIFNGLGIRDDDLATPSRLSEGLRERMIRYIYFHNNSTNVIANLYPFLSFMFCSDCKREHFFLYNSRRGDRIAYLSYECGHEIECDNIDHFEKRFSASGVVWAVQT